MPIIAVNVVKVLFAAALYGFLFYVARAMRGHIAGPPVTAAATPAPPSSVRQPSGAGPVRVPTLELTLPDGSTRRHLLDGVVVLGRGESADIQLDDEYASDRHASFSREGGRVMVSDLGSTNGTTLDGVAVTKPTAIQPDSTVIVGQTRVAVR